MKSGLNSGEKGWHQRVERMPIARLGSLGVLEQGSVCVCKLHATLSIPIEPFFYT